MAVGFEKVTASVVKSNPEVLADFMKLAKKHIETKTYKGEEVRAFNAHEISKETEKNANGEYWNSRNKIQVQDVADILQELVDKAKLPVKVYKRDRQRWDIGDPEYNEWKQNWNAAEGDPNKCSELMGADDWGEEIMDAKACERKYDKFMDLDDELAEKKVSASGGRGRRGAEMKLDENFIETLRDLFAE